jgi:signal transduction histidine kinase
MLASRATTVALGLTGTREMTENCTTVVEHDEGTQTGDVAELRASRRRLLLAADAERRGIERALHDGVQQELIGLAADVELAAAAVETDPDAVSKHLEEIRRGLRHALEEMRTLANRIYPALDAGGLAAALRFAAAQAGVRARIDVAVDRSIPSELASAVYFCCLQVLGQAEGVGTTISIEERDDGVAFEVLVEGSRDASGSQLRDRVEALGGSLDVRSEPGPRTVWSGLLPVSR